MRAGILPLYLEKPLARSQHDADRIVAAAAGPTVCAVGYQWRAVDVLADLRAALAGQTAGCLVGESVGGTQSRPWFLTQTEGGGNLLERGSRRGSHLAVAIAAEAALVTGRTTSVSGAAG